MRIDTIERNGRNERHTKFDWKDIRTAPLWRINGTGRGDAQSAWAGETFSIRVPYPDDVRVPMPDGTEI